MSLMSINVSINATLSEATGDVRTWNYEHKNIRLHLMAVKNNNIKRKCYKFVTISRLLVNTEADIVGLEKEMEST